MTDLIFSDQDRSFQTIFRTDLLKGNDGIFTVMHIIDRQPLEERLGMDIQELENDLGNFKTIAQNNNLRLERNDGSTNTVLVAVTSLNITTASLPDGNDGVAYDQTVDTEGGVGALTFTVDSGALPTGLSLDADTGQISGTPSGTGTSNFDIKVADEAGNEDVQSLSITINA